MDHSGVSDGVYAAVRVSELFCDSGEAEAGAGGDRGRGSDQRGPGLSFGRRVPFRAFRGRSGHRHEPGSGRGAASCVFCREEWEPSETDKGKVE